MIIYFNSTYDQKVEEDMKLLVKKKQTKKNTLLKEVIKYMLLLIFKFQPPLSPLN